MCVVQDLLTNKRETVNITRMMKCSGELDNAEVPEEVLDLLDRTKAKYEVVDRIVDIPKVENVVWLRVSLGELPEPRNYTWATIDDLFENIPDMVKEYLRTCRKKKLFQAAVRTMNISI